MSSWPSNRNPISICTEPPYVEQMQQDIIELKKEINMLWRRETELRKLITELQNAIPPKG